MLKELLNKYSDEGHERLGFVLEDLTVVELTNCHEDPEHGAKYLSQDLFNYVYNPKYPKWAIATWHTHPSEPKNLTGEDYTSFRNHPQLTHYIIGNDGVAHYTVDSKGTVKND